MTHSGTVSEAGPKIVSANSETTSDGSRVDLDGMGPSAMCFGNKTGGGVDVAARPNCDEKICPMNCVQDGVHLIGHFAEPDDIGAGRRCAAQ